MTTPTYSRSDRADRDFVLTDGEFDEIRQLVRQHTGISLSESKRELVYSRLVRRLRRLGMVSFADYIGLLRAGAAEELEEFSNAITTNLTAFFRENHHFEYLAEAALPLIEKRNAASRRLRIWSAGCSTGEEPYSIAMVLLAEMQRFQGWDVKILATDIDSQVLAHATAGRYAAERAERVPPRYTRYFLREDDGNYLVKPEARALVSFRQLNLMQPWPMRGPFDIVFCRNVVIYFDKPTQIELFRRLSELQKVGDYLFVGHSESLFKVCDQYDLIGKTAFRRIAG